MKSREVAGSSIVNYKMYKKALNKINVGGSTRIRTGEIKVLQTHALPLSYTPLRNGG